MKLSEKELLFIKSIINEFSLGIDFSDYEKLNKEDVLKVINFGLSRYIGYDYKSEDIDEVGKLADDIISKLLIMLEQRGEM